jgi:AraC-like DNA-binding protein
MPPIPLSRSCILGPATAFLRRIGAPVGRLLAGVGLPEWTLDDPECLLPATATIRFLDHAAHQQGIDALGFLAGQERPTDALGVLGRIVNTSPTLGEALRAQIENHRTFSTHGRLWLRTVGDHVELCQSFAAGFDDGWSQADHYFVSQTLSLMRLGAGRDWRPSRVQFQTGEARALRDVALLARSSVAFAQPVSAVAFPRELLAAPIHLGEPTERATDLDAWRASAPADDFAGAVGQVVATLSRRAYPRLRETASLLGESTRTLQRRLAAGGVTHESLVDRARLSAAALLLAGTDTRILDVALDVGYSDHAHFTRAFRRWTGTTPLQYRRTRRADGATARWVSLSV